MPTVSRTFDTRPEATAWVNEIKVTDNVVSDKIEQTPDEKWKAIVEIE